MEVRNPGMLSNFGEYAFLVFLWQENLGLT
jgi:hypothetical protein